MTKTPKGHTDQFAFFIDDKHFPDVKIDEGGERIIEAIIEAINETAAGVLEVVAVTSEINAVVLNRRNALPPVTEDLREKMKGYSFYGLPYKWEYLKQYDGRGRQRLRNKLYERNCEWVRRVMEILKVKWIQVEIENGQINIECGKFVAMRPDDLRLIKRAEETGREPFVFVPEPPSEPYFS